MHVFTYTLYSAANDNKYSPAIYPFIGFGDAESAGDS